MIESGESRDYKLKVLIENDRWLTYIWCIFMVYFFYYSIEFYYYGLNLIKKQIYKAFSNKKNINNNNDVSSSL